MSEREIDNELVAQVLKGDKEAFDILVLKYQRKICQLIGRKVDEAATVNDIAQDTFIKAYRSLKSFQGNSAFYTWLYRIAINTTKNFLKVKGRRPPAMDIDFEDAELLPGRFKLSDHATPERLLMREELQGAVLTAVNTLPEELRTSIILREMAGLSYEEIANVMQCPVGTVRSRIFRAREVVDTKLKPFNAQSRKEAKS